MVYARDPSAKKAIASSILVGEMRKWPWYGWLNSRMRKIALATETAPSRIDDAIAFFALGPRA